MNKQYEWAEFYTAFADVLLTFKGDRTLLITKLRQAYDTNNIKWPKLEWDFNPTDIDPFSVFGMFNKGISQQNRIKIIRALSEEFGITEPVPSNFDGIPLVNNLSATFYRFAQDREDGDIDRLWDLFEAAIRFADLKTSGTREKFVATYDRVYRQKRVKWNLSMGLFWARPYCYINLDSRNRWYISGAEMISPAYEKAVRGLLKTVPDPESYLRLIELTEHEMYSGSLVAESFIELSSKAWITSEEFNQQERLANSLFDEDVKEVHYWTYSPGGGASQWDECYTNGIMVLGWGEIGDMSLYETKDEMRSAIQDAYNEEGSCKNSAHATWQFTNVMRPGDIVFAKKGNREVVGRGVVKSGYHYDENRSDKYKSYRYVEWTDNGLWMVSRPMAQKTLTDITAYSESVQELNSLFDTDALDVDEDQARDYPAYTADNFLSEVYMDEVEYDNITHMLRVKKNIVLQGAPGVGKTFAAKRLAYSMMGVKDIDRVAMVQFHQSYSYEDFIMGFRPTESGFELRKGVFYNFCKKAEIDSDNEYFFIIDEINRGNLSKIFGELFMLIENDKRGVELQLLYSDEKFSVPANVYIIGMMNTADRGLAMLDYALRRRFAFISLVPGFETDGFRAYRSGLNNKKLDNLVLTVEKLNNEISSDDSLGEGFCIGHSYFCGFTEETISDKSLGGIVEYELIPLVSEYWFDEPTKVRDWSSSLRRAIK